LPIAANTQGSNYAEFRWTPETWFKAILDSPLADDGERSEIEGKVTNMVAWRWMLVPLFVVDVGAFGVTVAAWRRLRMGIKERVRETDVVEK